MGLSRDDWIATALHALLEGGPDAVAVEPLARTLGATKGSFYWHFESRSDLLAAALAEWERASTDDVITALSSIDDPLARLRGLLEVAFLTEETHPVEAAVAVHASHPEVAPIAHRVTQRRMAYVEECFAALGFSERDAHARAVITYSAFVGWFQLRACAPDVTAPKRVQRDVATLLGDLVTIRDPERLP